ncbi:hypothetical protein [Flavobacterium soyangense]|uniref:Uncharacterized protein n=1 Tax=Flavobacterium soyangense TaxID=2023265 RepID=A0A930Y1Q8_9FLAO|nr:hypothetical protein [Flavobacterium soyangense]MBF2709729.1 hypothetical protein [Flavobacterium soyangense]
MKTISLKLDDSIYGETENIVKSIKKPRNRYINDALEYYNKMQSRLILQQKLHFESKLVSESSMEVLKEFEQIDTLYESI